MSAPYEAGGPPSGAPGGKTSLGLESNVGAMLCYIANIICCLGVILAVIFLVTEKENRFVKFHAVQSLFLVGVQLVVGIAVGIVGLLFRMALSTADLALIAVLLVFGLRIILLLVFLAIWIFAGVKAYGGQWYKLPLIGNLAWNTVNK
jgi:uncharacterized membrane protein